MGYTLLLEEKEVSLKEELRQEIEASVSKLLTRYTNEEIRSELYKLFRVPPFVITRENEVVFLNTLEYN